MYRCQWPRTGDVRGPVPAQILDCLADVVGHNVDLGGGPRTAHGDVPELSAAAVSEQVGGVEGGPLAAVDRRRVTVGEAVGACVFHAEGVGCPVVHAYREPPSSGIDGDDAAPLGGDQPALS